MCLESIISKLNGLLNRGPNSGFSEIQYSLEQVKSKLKLIEAQTSQLGLSPNQNKYVILNKIIVIYQTQYESENSTINHKKCTNFENLNQEY